MSGTVYCWTLRSPVPCSVSQCNSRFAGRAHQFANNFGDSDPNSRKLGSLSPNRRYNTATRSSPRIRLGRGRGATRRCRVGENRWLGGPPFDDNAPRRAARPLFDFDKYWAECYGTAPFLPMSRAEMDLLGWDSWDVIIVTGDAYVDHP